MAKTNCVDISYCQTNVNFNTLKNAEVTSVIIRAGYGRETSQKDNMFESHYKGAKAAGLNIGIYWYSYANSVADAEKEAKACLSIIKGKTFELPIYYDMEENSIASLGKTTCTNMAIKFCDTIQAAGYRAGVYANPNWYSNYLNYSTLKSKYSIWLAHWNSSHSISCDIWQHGVGTISGVSGQCDLDYIENSSIIKKNSSTSTKSTTTSKNNGVSAQTVINTAYNLLNHDEHAGQCDIMYWYGGFSTAINSVACCCAGQMYLFYKAGAFDLIPGGKVADCGSLCKNFYNAGQLYGPNEVKPGDLVIFSWSKSRSSYWPASVLGYNTLDHVELCVAVNNDGTITCIGANNGGYECDDFQKKTRYKSNISCCCRPKYRSSSSSSSSGSSSSSSSSSSGNSSIKTIQNWLNNNYNTGISVDGIYGPQTKKALVKALQTELNKQFSAGLTVDGKYGNLTNSKIVNIKYGNQGNITRILQGLLICNGYSTNGFDGLYGTSTMAAVKSYQSKNGLTADGIAGKNTFSKLCS